MNISKTLFKLLSKCENAPSLYNMYINRGFHDVKVINGIEIEMIKEELSKIKEEEFSEELLDVENSIFSHMFDEETGEDLTIVTSAQLQAFQEIFKDVEMLAAKHVEKIFNHPVVYAENTYDQKKYEYFHNGNRYYCYLDIYFENKKKLKVFEVKATTSRKIDEVHFQVKPKTPMYPVFEMNNETKIMDWAVGKFVGQTLEETEITEEIILKKLKTQFDRYSDLGKYFYDVAIQRHIIEESFRSLGNDIPEIDYYLVVLNHEYIYDGKTENGKRVYDTSKDGNDLFKVYDVNYITKIYQDVILKEREQLDKNSQKLMIVNNCLGKHCRYKKNDQCKFFNICHSPLFRPDSLLEFTDKSNCFKHLTELNSSKKRKTISMYDLINQGIYTMKDALIYTVNVDQQIEYNCYLKNEQYVDKDNLSFIIKQIKYPIYHLDFESYNCPLPRFYGETPYMQSLFQYSLHVEKTPGDCEIDNTNGKYHYEFLAPDHNDHRRALAEQMIKDIDLSNGGTVLAYHADFEKNRIKELIRIFPDLKNELQIILDSVFDLEKVLHAGKDFYKKIDPNYSLIGKPKYNFYDINLHASFSIKKILPLFTDLTYNNLDVKNGTEAILVYGMLSELTDDEYKSKYLALKEYCRQDTWSMVKILQGLKKLIE